MHPPTHPHTCIFPGIKELSVYIIHVCSEILTVCVFKTRPLAFNQINLLIIVEEEEMRNSTVVTAFLCCCSAAAMGHLPSLQTRHDSSRLAVDGRSAAFIWTHSSRLQNSYLHLSIFRSTVAAFWWCRRESVKSVCINQVLVSTSTFNKRV